MTAKQDQIAGLKDILLKIAEDEKRHRFLLKNTVDFLSRPKTWIENAEFHHLDEYQSLGGCPGIQIKNEKRKIKKSKWKLRPADGFINAIGGKK